MPPDLIAGRYRVDRAVGAGGMGTVWLCRDEMLQRLVAVKQVGVVAGESADDTRRAMREARTAAALNHRNAVSIYDVVEHDGAPWLVMEYFPSHTLSELLADGPLPVRRVAAIGAQVAAALAGAHEAGIVHRDVKPGNILVGYDDVAKISDFGIARLTHDDQLTQTGLVIGTPAYFAPEVARGGTPGPASDAWALGASLYAAVEGHPPHPRQANAVATLAVIVSEPVRRPVRAGVLTDVIGHLMEPDPTARWSMARAEQALRALAVDAPTPTAPVPTTAASPEPRASAAVSTRRSRLLPLALGVAVLLLLGIVAVVLITATGRDGRTGANEPGPSRSGSTSSAPESRSPSPDAGSPTPDGSTSPAPATGAATPTAPTAAAAPQGGPVGTIETYFATVPGDLDAGWALLAPAMQARVGRDSFDGFWATISDVSVSDVRAVSGTTVTAEVAYTRTDGTPSVERQTFQLQRQGDGYLIAADR